MKRAGVALALLVAVLATLAPAAYADAADFPDLTAGTRVYDETGRSLSTTQTAALQRRLDALEARTGADVVVLVRDREADPEETLEEVEALQQAWVAATGTDQDTAGALLVDREPGSDDDARAGVFLGSTYDDGNVPRREQEDLVEEALIPPLRDGDVARGLTAAVDRLENDIRDGPPAETGLRGLVDRSPALQWGYAALVALGFLAALLLFLRSHRPTSRRPPRTTHRPDEDTPHALVATLVGPSALFLTHTVPATLLALADRRAVALEQGQGPSGPSGLQVRLVDEDAVGPAQIDRAVWRELRGCSHGDVVRGADLRRVSAPRPAYKEAIREDLRSRGWYDDGYRRGLLRWGLVGGWGAALLGLGFAIVTDDGWVVGVAALSTFVLVLGVVFLALAHPVLSSAGREASQAWKAYKAGLRKADVATLRSIGVDDLLADIVALNLRRPMRRTLASALENRPDGPHGALAVVATGSAVDGWRLFNNTFPRSSGGGGTVSGGGAGGGGGAAGST
ncbi:hypothetical protein GCM10011519_28950 [Marmoricola endophyticus]|uniref:TPM domain-containing protein n=1 Tax=Marmoricola endophyticus TaxID=2040280 RepID=A0A917BNP1_9ACTN|nr:TPM domain-containing protein [Marmoricola endophyticus]GGF53249.1 hypothetical protein GCM10011519_28950 [Marmoricola endophyticus]